MKRTVLVLLLCVGTAVACNDAGTAESTASASDATRFARWQELSEAGDNAAARAELEALRAREGNSAELAFRLGVTLERMDDLAKAVRTYREALEAYPETPMLWLALGRDYLTLSRWQKARDALLEARELGAADEFVAYDLGICFGNLDEPELSEAEFHKALEAGYDPSSVKYNLALLRTSENNYREAKRLLEEVLAERPDHYEALREYGFVLIKTTKDPETVAEVQRLAWDVVDHRPEDWRAHMLLGDAFMAADDYEAAVEAYTRALEYSQNLPEVEARYIEAERNRRAVADQGDASEIHDHSETVSDPDSGESEKSSR